MPLNQKSLRTFPKMFTFTFCLEAGSWNTEVDEQSEEIP